jgi:hypothetical protein
MADVEMNKGVQILLERMSSNPDEFVPDIQGKYPNKWRNIILSVAMRMQGGKDYHDQLPFLKDEEIKTLWEKLINLQGDLFTKQVMNTLLSESIEPPATVRLNTSPHNNIPCGTVNVYPPTTVIPPLITTELSLLSRQVVSGRLKGKF